MIKLLKYVMAESNLKLSPLYLNWIILQFDYNDFKGVERLTFSFLGCCYELNILPSNIALSSYLKTSAKTDIKTYNIGTDDTSDGYWDITTIEEAYNILSGQLLAYWQEAESYDTFVDFKLIASEYLSEKRTDALALILGSGLSKLNDGTDTIMLTEDIEVELNRIREKYSDESLKDLDFMSAQVGETNAKSTLLAKTPLSCINTDSGGIYTKRIITINGQPGGGKSRFAFIVYVYPTLLAGNDVIVYETEMTKEDVENIIICHHLTMINKGKYKLPDSAVAMWDDLSQQQKELYEAAKMDLFSGRYGRLIVVTTDNLPIEKLKMDIRSKVKVNPSIKMVCIDYMGDFKTDYLLANKKHKTQWEIVTDGYAIAKSLNTSLDLSYVCVNQYNDDGIDAAYAGKRIKSGMCQGGHVVQRSTSYDLNLTYTAEQDAANIRSLSSNTKSRHSKGFDNVTLKVDLSVSMFNQISV